MKNLEMKELEIVTGGAKFIDTGRVKDPWGLKFVNKPTTTFVCDYDKEDMEYLEDILDPEDLYNCFAV